MIFFGGRFQASWKFITKLPQMLRVFREYLPTWKVNFGGQCGVPGTRSQIFILKIWLSNLHQSFGGWTLVKKQFESTTYKMGPKALVINGVMGPYW